MAMICPDGALTKISVMFQKSALMVLSSSHINRDDSGGIKWSWVLLHPDVWKQISAPALHISILQMGKPVKIEVQFWWEMENFFTVQAEVLTVQL